MPEPDDYGLDAVQTLSHIAAPCRVANFGGFWHRWRETVAACEPRLTPTREPLAARAVSHFRVEGDQNDVACRWPNLFRDG